MEPNKLLFVDNETYFLLIDGRYRPFEDWETSKAFFKNSLPTIQTIEEAEIGSPIGRIFSVVRNDFDSKLFLIEKDQGHVQRREITKEQSTALGIREITYVEFVGRMVMGEIEVGPPVSFKLDLELEQALVAQPKTNGLFVDNGNYFLFLDGKFRQFEDWSKAAPFFLNTNATAKALDSKDIEPRMLPSFFQIVIFPDYKLYLIDVNRAKGPIAREINQEQLRLLGLKNPHDSTEFESNTPPPPFSLPRGRLYSNGPKIDLDSPFPSYTEIEAESNRYLSYDLTRYYLKIGNYFQSDDYVNVSAKSRDRGNRYLRIDYQTVNELNANFPGSPLLEKPDQMYLPSFGVFDTNWIGGNFLIKISNLRLWNSAKQRQEILAGVRKSQADNTPGLLVNVFNGSEKTFGQDSEAVSLPAISADWTNGFTLEVDIWYDGFSENDSIIELRSSEYRGGIRLCSTEKGEVGFVPGNLSERSIYTPRNTLRLKEWLHLAVTVDKDGKATVYIDGKVAALGGPTSADDYTVLRAENGALFVKDVDIDGNSILRPVPEPLSSQLGLRVPKQASLDWRGYVGTGPAIYAPTNDVNQSLPLNQTLFFHKGDYYVKLDNKYRRIEDWNAFSKCLMPHKQLARYWELDARQLDARTITKDFRVFKGNDQNYHILDQDHDGIPIKRHISKGSTVDFSPIYWMGLIVPTEVDNALDKIAVGPPVLDDADFPLYTKDAKRGNPSLVYTNGTYFLLLDGKFRQFEDWSKAASFFSNTNATDKVLDSKDIEPRMLPSIFQIVIFPDYKLYLIDVDRANGPIAREINQEQLRLLGLKDPRDSAEFKRNTPPPPFSLPGGRLCSDGPKVDLDRFFPEYTSVSKEASPELIFDLKDYYLKIGTRFLRIDYNTVNTPKGSPLGLPLKGSPVSYLPKNVKRESNWIGKSNWTPPDNALFHGELSNVRLWSRAKTKQQILAGMNKPQEDDSAGLIVNCLKGTKQLFNGITDQVPCPAINPDFKEGLTVEVEVNFHSFKSFSSIIDFGQGVGKNNIRLCNPWTQNRMAFYVFNETTAHCVFSPLNTLRLNEWIHLAATVDKSGKMTLYVNGNVVAQGGLTTADDYTVLRAKSGGLFLKDFDVNGNPILRPIPAALSNHLDLEIPKHPSPDWGTYTGTGPAIYAPANDMGQTLSNNPQLFFDQGDYYLRLDNKYRKIEDWEGLTKYLTPDKQLAKRWIMDSTQLENRSIKKGFKLFKGTDNKYYILDHDNDVDPIKREISEAQIDQLGLIAPAEVDNDLDKRSKGPDISIDTDFPRYTKDAKKGNPSLVYADGKYYLKCLHAHYLIDRATLERPGLFKNSLPVWMDSTIDLSTVSLSKEFAVLRSQDNIFYLFDSDQDGNRCIRPISTTLLDQLQLNKPASAAAESIWPEYSRVMDPMDAGSRMHTFNGESDYILLDEPKDIFGLNHEVTMEALFYSKSPIAGTQDSRGEDFKSIITKQFAFGLYTRHGKLWVFDFKDRSNSYSSSETTYTTGNWHHIAFTFDGKEKKVYVDGIAGKVTDKARTAYEIANSAGRLFIGASDCYGNSEIMQYFDGTINRARVVNRVLSGEEIAYSYSSSFGLNDKLKHYKGSYYLRLDNKYRKICDWNGFRKKLNIADCWCCGTIPATDVSQIDTKRSIPSYFDALQDKTGKTYLLDCDDHGVMIKRPAAQDLLMALQFKLPAKESDELLSDVPLGQPADFSVGFKPTPVSTSFPEGYPFAIGFSNTGISEENSSLFIISDHSRFGYLENVKLTLSNKTSRNYTASALVGPADKTNHHYHFRLTFRNGTLHEVCEKAMKDGLSKGLQTALPGKWSVVGPDMSVAGQTTWYMASSIGFSIPPSGKIEFTVKGLYASPLGGARSTALEFGFMGMDGNPSTEFVATTPIEIVNHQGNAPAPLSFGVLENNFLLNNTENSFKVYMRPLIDGGIALEKDKTKIVFSFYAHDDVSPTSAKPHLHYELRSSEEDDELGPESRSYEDDPIAPIPFAPIPFGSISAIQAITADSIKFSEPNFDVKPFPMDAKNKRDIELTCNKGSIGLTIFDFNKIHISGPEGVVKLHIKVQNLPGYWDTNFEVDFIKGPLAIGKDKDGLDLLGIGMNPTAHNGRLQVSGRTHLNDELVVEKKTTISGELNVDNAVKARDLQLNETLEDGILGKGSRIEFLSGATSNGKVNVSIEEYFGLNLIGANGKPVKVRRTDLEVSEGRIKDKTGDLMPVGSIIAYVGDSDDPPAGWLWCDGQRIPDDDIYNELKGKFKKEPLPQTINGITYYNHVYFTPNLTYAHLVENQLYSSNYTYEKVLEHLIRMQYIIKY
jgi:predicted Ser/Thr protein kinase